MPAATESTTVTIITTSPSQMERVKAAPRSTMPVPANSFEKQCSDTPFIGKVSPPSGPWKDRMKMANIGP